MTELVYLDAVVITESRQCQNMPLTLTTGLCSVTRVFWPENSVVWPSSKGKQ